MKGCSFLILFAGFLFIGSCQHKGPLTVKPTVDTNKSSISYPFTDTFYGAYTEYNADVAPYNFTGSSTVYLHHITLDSIIIDAQSIGLPHGNMDYPAIIWYPTHIVSSGNYSFSVQWYNDRWDSYNCTLGGDSLSCSITQTTASAANFGVYNGNYNGKKK